jgi:hypothetical protein
VLATNDICFHIILFVKWRNNEYLHIPVKVATHSVSKLPPDFIEHSLLFYQPWWQFSSGMR